MHLHAPFNLIKSHTCPNPLLIRSSTCFINKQCAAHSRCHPLPHFCRKKPKLSDNVEAFSAKCKSSGASQMLPYLQIPDFMNTSVICFCNQCVAVFLKLHLASVLARSAYTSAFAHHAFYKICLKASDLHQC